MQRMMQEWKFNTKITYDDDDGDDFDDYAMDAN